MNARAILEQENKHELLSLLRPGTAWVGIIVSGGNALHVVYIGKTADRLYAKLAEWCRHRWPEVTDDTGEPVPQPESDEEAVNAFFEAHCNFRLEVDEMSL